MSYSERRRRLLISARGCFNRGAKRVRVRNSERVGEESRRLANAFSVHSVVAMSQGCGNPGLKLVNAFGVQSKTHFMNRFYRIE